MVKCTLLLLAALVLLAPGCAYPIYVLGSNEPASPVPLSNATSIAVSDHHPAGTDAELRRQTADKIERLLADRGYKVVSPEESAVLLFFRYERESTFKKIVLESSSGVSGGIWRKRWRSVTNSWAQAASVSGRWKAKTRRLRGWGSSPLVKKDSTPVLS